MSSEFLKVSKVKIQKKSGFDKSHQNLLTTKVGTITPLLVDEVIPNETVNLKVNLSATLPPLASDTFMRCQLKTEAFFVPSRLLNGAYEEWLTGSKLKIGTGEFDAYMPTLVLSTGTTSGITGPGTLCDYLGFSWVSGSTTSYPQSGEISALPFLAYHKIWDDWYRNPLITRSCFTKCYPISAGQVDQLSGLRFAPWMAYRNQGIARNSFTSTNNDLTLADGKTIYMLRQRNFGADYFTTATPSAQNGAAQSVSFDIPIPSGITSGSSATTSSKFTISALRAANSMQQFLERNNIAGSRLVDYVRAHYGASLSDGVAQRSVLLGSAAFDVYSKGIYQTQNGVSGQTSTNNPFDGSVGAEFGSAYASGSDFIIKGFTANEPGYIFVMVSLVPKVTYSTGIRRYLTHYVGAGSVTDMANPLLQNVGQQPIYKYEVNGNLSDTGVWGYTDRFAEFKTIEDQLHGLLRDGQSLQSFALQKSFPLDSVATITTQSLEIPTNYLNQVTAVNNAVSNYGVWIDSFLDYKVSMPLAQYAIPSLQDPAYEHGNEITVQRGGSYIRG